ncbi:glycoside hydrolase family 15 protein [Vulgatibacter incomptus]|uniref:Glucoamylase n=1 Tax=Vulgatibacter incomptus TaxID=1391653 RepID=A0A0K1PG33_9BACT|nr:glycoside hydrolase family 15 protein [Vulgatibacter incomptus]AKU92376.1 Glucoamylase [Vulgatibacter incomptus]
MAARANIQDYGIIGDCRSAALISREGSLDWLCWPRFDGPSLFAAILDHEKGGRFRIRPSTRHVSTRRYLPGTNVLETRFETSHGTLVLTDLMPVATEAEKKRLVSPEHEVLRVARCEEGEVELEVEYDPRPDFGRKPAKLRFHERLGVSCAVGRHGQLLLRSQVPLHPHGGGARGSARLAAGQEVVFRLCFATDAPAVFPPFDDAADALNRTLSYWQGWNHCVGYDGPYREAVVRSALTLCLLIYAPSGAIVASPTTSLPEELGGDKNWDYRYCWLRDASFTVRALFGLGYADEAEAFVSWLLHTTKLTRPRLRVLYDVYGEVPPPEHEVPLAGFRGSRPVRLGNAAEGQLQLDVYGEVIDAAAQYIHQGGTFDRETARMLIQFGHYVCDNWQLPDEGIWEVRSGRYPHVHSRVLCWTALDRLLELHIKGHLGRAPEERFRKVRAEIRANVEEKGWNERIQSYVQVEGSAHVDAALLLLPWYGFEKASTTRMRKTFARIRKELHANGSLLYRYATHGGTTEGAFGICSFWAAEFLARGGGTVAEAQAAFDGLLCYGNDLGLFSEEVDPATGHALGNFPQGFTHVGLINAALAIRDRMEGQVRVEHHVLPHRNERAARR